MKQEPSLSLVVQIDEIIPVKHLTWGIISELAEILAFIVAAPTTFVVL